MSFYSTCGMGCVMETAYVPFMVFTAVALFFMAKALGRTVTLLVLLVVALIPWGLGHLGQEMILEKIQQAQKAAEPAGQAIPVAVDSRLLWYIPWGTTALMLIFGILIWIKSKPANSASH